MHKFIDSLQTPNRYLTLFYGLTLGLAFILALLAIFLHGNSMPDTQNAGTARSALPHAATPTSPGSQALASAAPTELPIIIPTDLSKPVTSLAVTTNELQGVKVNLWHPWTGERGEALQAIVNEFNQTNPWGILVQVQGFEDFGRLDEAVEAALLANGQPDVIVDYGYQASHWDGVEALVDLTPYVNDPIWGFSDDEQADFYPAFWGEDNVENKQSGQTRRLGIPFYRSAYVLFYNQSWARELGYTKPPITAEDFRDQACAATRLVNKQGDKSDLGKGGWLITPQPGVMVNWIYAFGGEITNPGAPGYLFNTPETRNAFEYLAGLQDIGCAWSDGALDSQTEFANRHTLFVTGSLFDIPDQQEAFQTAGNEDVWITIPFPSSHQPVVDTYGPSLLVTRSNPARQLAAWLAIKWLVNPPNQANWVATLQTYPTRVSSLDYLAEAADRNPQWAQALELLPVTQSEPSLASWKVMRWALEDVMKELFDPQFKADQTPMLLEKLDRVADEIYSQVY